MNIRNFLHGRQIQEQVVLDNAMLEKIDAYLEE